LNTAWKTNNVRYSLNRIRILQSLRQRVVQPTVKPFNTACLYRIYHLTHTFSNIALLVDIHNTVLFIYNWWQSHKKCKPRA